MMAAVDTETEYTRAGAGGKPNHRFAREFACLNLDSRFWEIDETIQNGSQTSLGKFLLCVTSISASWICLLLIRARSGLPKA